MADTQILYGFVGKGRFKEAVAETENLLKEGFSPHDIVNKALIPAMEEVGKRFENGTAYVPEMLIAAKAMKSCLEILKPHMLTGTSSTIGKVVIGTVRGDLHDIGKNLVASMLEGVGFEVINLGVDVSDEKFVEAIKIHKPQIVCLSALLTTTMVNMAGVIEAIKQAGIREQVNILVGGAPLSAGFAQQIGADGYSDNANSAATLAKRLIAG